MDRLKRFLEAGVSCFIDVTEPSESPPYEAFLPFATPDGRRIAYLREPIPDHDVPRGGETMTRILRMVDDALAAGHVVYLHCRAGVGRSSMVVGCWLASRRPPGTDVLDELQTLWRQSARSRIWSMVPETEEQVDFVRHWNGAARPESTLTAAPALRERAAGVLFGLAAGDAYGASLAVPGTSGQWTQHTSLALCVADSLVASCGLDARDQMERFLRWQNEGYLAATSGPQQASADVVRALAAYRWRGQPMAGSHDPRDHGTASLTRAVIAALVEPDAARAVALAGECSRTTHQSPIVIDVCRLLAAIVCGILREDPRALVDLPYAPDPGFWDTRPLKREVAALDLRPGEELLADGAPQEDAIRALAHARAAVTGAVNFEAAVRAAVVGAPDPALAGALTGALAGGVHGLRGLPVPMIESLRRRELLDELLTRVLTQRARVLAAMYAATPGA